MNQEKIGKFIQECSKEKKIKQSELAEKLGVSDRTIGNWENGRNMPDLSLFKPLCDVLEISINDFLSGEKVEEKNYQNKLEENIITTIDYSNKKIDAKNNLIGIILIIVGVIMSITAIAIFKSESSWGSVYSVLGVIISLIGISRYSKKLSYGKRLICNFGYFILFIMLLFIIDYIGVINLNQPPRFATNIISYGSTERYYDTIFYDVITCNGKDYKVIKNQSSKIENFEKICKS